MKGDELGSAETDPTVVVPPFVGLSIPEARALANETDLILTSDNPDGPPLGSLTWPGRWVVTSQRPPAGPSIERGGFVTVTFARDDDGGDSGDREPRVPTPPEKLLAVELPEPAVDRDPAA